MAKKTEKDLADECSCFASCLGITVHYKLYDKGAAIVATPSASASSSSSPAVASLSYLPSHIVVMSHGFASSVHSFEGVRIVNNTYLLVVIL